MRPGRISISLALTVLTAALAAGIGTASAEEQGPNAWCFRPLLIWHPIELEPSIETQSFVPSIHCEVRELPADDGTRWSSERTPEFAAAPDGWSLPTRSIRSTRWGWVHEYDASTGETYVYGKMKRTDSNGTADIYLNAFCSASGALHLSLGSDVAPVAGSHSVVWWTDRGQYRRAERWDAEEISDGSEFFRSWAPSPHQLWAAIRDSSRLHVLVFGERSWYSANAYVARINQLDIVEMLDYCGQDERFGEAADE